MIDAELVELVKDIDKKAAEWRAKIDEQICFMVKQGQAQALVKHKLVAIEYKLKVLQAEAETLLRMLE